MKKINQRIKNLFTLILLIVIIVFSSCKKDWTCNCTTTTTYNYGTSNDVKNETSTYTYKKQTNQVANQNCYSYNNSEIITSSSSIGVITNTVTTIENCTLK